MVDATVAELVETLADVDRLVVHCGADLAEKRRVLDGVE